MNIQTMIENGFAIKKIASLFSISEQYIKVQIKTNNWTLIKESFDDSKIDYICNLYKSGISSKNLGIKFSIDKRRIQKWVKEIDILRSKSNSHRLTNFNQNIFDTIDSEEKAYWLGFLYADAYNCKRTNTFSLTLATKDLNHIEKFTKFIGLPKDQILTELNGKYWSSNIKLYSKHICEQMERLGCPQAKSFIIRYPSWLDSKYNVSFIRGLFDGDGCLTLRLKNKEWKWSLVSTKECLESISNIIRDEIGLTLRYECISKTNNNTYCMECTGNERIKKICDWLWLDSKDLRLERKYQKYIDLCNQQYNRTFLKNVVRESHFK